MRLSQGIDAAGLLTAARARSGLSQRDLAKRAGTAQSVVARIELRESNPTVATLNRLLAAAGFEARVELRRESVVLQARDEVRERVRRFFAAVDVPGVASVYLFGSAARRAMHAESDVDVAVLLDRSIHGTRIERSQLRVRLSAELVAATGMNDVDLVILNDLPPLFSRSIVLGGDRLLRPESEIDHAFVRDVQLRAADVAPFLRWTRALKLQRLRA